jgi:hypothetical protein
MGVCWNSKGVYLMPKLPILTGDEVIKALTNAVIPILI